MRRACCLAFLAGTAGCGDSANSDASAPGAQIYVADYEGFAGGITAWFYNRDWPGERTRPTADACEFDDHGFLGACDPTCSEGLACAPNGDCIQAPVLMNAGTMTVRGTSAGDIMVAQDPSGAYFYQQEAFLLEGATRVDVSTSGSDRLAAFGISLDVPVGQLAIDGYGEPGWPSLAPARDLDLSWGDVDAESRIRMILRDDPGGVALWCDVMDTGSITVPGDLVSAFLSAARWNVEQHALSGIERYRETIVTVEGDRRVLLDVVRGLAFRAAPAM